jgi:hypothetical protein
LPVWDRTGLTWRDQEKTFRVLGFLLLMAALLAGMSLMFDAETIKGPVPLLLVYLGRLFVSERGTHMQPKMKESVSLKLFLGLRNVIEVRRTRPSRKLENDRANLEAGNLKPEI